ncbi:hypothetical protein [Leisingera sp. M523]|uniref:hypothetical protein n=1 Tax=Leisingera sp. M523 TaxID=2867013 RepID=UPI0021A29ACF|nr:hypothetical protein [Leisingera sp. M523]UWQ30227.1 hypothetical protein K3557_06740 [Leisingera sp. M523]
MGTEGAQVRQAFDGPTVEHDALIGQFAERIREERARSSDSSESAAKANKFLEDTGLNSQAYSWGKTIVKKLDMKDGQHKAMDVIRSMEAILPMLKDHVGGQGTGEMNLEGPKPKEEAKATAKPAAKPKRTAKPKADSKANPAPKPKADAKPDDQETEEFNSEVDQVMGDSKVTPLNFNRGASA